MSIDLQAMFALGEGLARAAITTSGTTVRCETRTPTTTPGTLDYQDTPVTVWERPGIITPAGILTGQPIPGAEVRSTDWRVTLTPDTPVPPARSWVVAAASRDPNLTGRGAQVIGHILSSAGAVLTVYARPGGLG